MKIDKQFIVNMLEQYLNGKKAVQDITNFTFDTIFSDEEMVSEKHSKLIYEIIFYLDNIDNGMFSFSKSQAKSLLTILESTEDQEIGIELVKFVKFREELIEFIIKPSGTEEKLAVKDGFKKMGDFGDDFGGRFWGRSPTEYDFYDKQSFALVLAIANDCQ